jgi:3-deoxy-7-phosphoheptulonate synthase
VTEAVDPDGVDAVAEAADVIQIGARNMQNYSLLRRAGKPVPCRGIAATIEELLLPRNISAEATPTSSSASVDPQLHTETRFLLDLGAIPAVHAPDLPIIADRVTARGGGPVPAMACAAVAAGADGLLVEVHHPGEARPTGRRACGRSSSSG